MRFLCNVSSYLKLPTFHSATALQHITFEGWKGMSALLRGLTLPISSRTMSCPQTLARRHVNYIKTAALKSSATVCKLSMRRGVARPCAV